MKAYFLLSIFCIIAIVAGTGFTRMLAAPVARIDVYKGSEIGILHPDGSQCNGTADDLLPGDHIAWTIDWYTVRDESGFAFQANQDDPPGSGGEWWLQDPWQHG